MYKIFYSMIVLKFNNLYNSMVTFPLICRPVR